MWKKIRWDKYNRLKKVKSQIKLHWIICIYAAIVKLDKNGFKSYKYHLLDIF